MVQRAIFVKVDVLPLAENGYVPAFSACCCRLPTGQVLLSACKLFDISFEGAMGSIYIAHLRLRSFNTIDVSVFDNLKWNTEEGLGLNLVRWGERLQERFPLSLSHCHLALVQLSLSKNWECCRFPAPRTTTTIKRPLEALC